MTALWQFVALLAGHWVADFICQSHWMASTKSKETRALLLHVSAYSAVMLGFAVLLFVRDLRTFAVVLIFIGFNGVLHFWTDYFTSRWTSRIRAEQRWHDFFVVIGLDQLIHQVTLAALMALLIAR